MEIEIIRKNVLIIGGGTAGCYAAGKIAEAGDLSVLIAEKANIKRSGCLAAGVNALNAYITPGHTPDDYVEYAKEDANGIVREDLLFTMSEHFNEVVEELEKMGLTILKDSEGNYVSRGWRNLKINGENIKPILADYAASFASVEIRNHVNVTDFLIEEDCGKKRIRGAVGFSVKENKYFIFYADAVLIAAGGAAGIYRPNNPGGNSHKMWYCPFNTGAGLAMGILAGAEMTTFEMRFIALRCKDTLAPTGTIAQGVGAAQVNARGENYEKKYGLKTYERVWGTVKEKKEGRGPCYLKTEGITKDQENGLYRAYLNMAPMQTLKWLGTGKNPSKVNVELDSSEPYIVGGHTASGYWVSTDRKTTIDRLYAAGDVCGGAPQKYVTGAMSEALIAACEIRQELISDYAGIKDSKETMEIDILKNEEKESVFGDPEALSVLQRYSSHFTQKNAGFSIFQVEEAMQKVMDEYAGGIKTDYAYNAYGLEIADKKIDELYRLLSDIHTASSDDLLLLYEVRDRLICAKTLIAHLKSRKETRWHSFQENHDYPERSSVYDLYVNSIYEDGKVRTFTRPLTERYKKYEHKD